MSTSPQLCTQRDHVFLTNDDTQELATLLSRISPPDFQSFQARLEKQDGFYVYRQFGKCQFLKDCGGCRLKDQHKGFKECFTDGVHVYLDQEGGLELRQDNDKSLAHLTKLQRNKRLKTYSTRILWYKSLYLKFRKLFPGDKTDTTFLTKITERISRQHKPDSMRKKAIPGTCRWCDKSIEPGKNGKPSRRTWHPECVELYMLANHSQSQRAFLLKRDNEVCSSCNRDCGAARRNALELLSDLKKHHAGSPRYGVLLEDYRRRLVWPKNCHLAGSWWQADHKLAICNNQGDTQVFSPDNLQTLCFSCHQKKTKEDVALRREIIKKSKVE